MNEGFCFESKLLIIIWTPAIVALFYHLHTHNSTTSLNTGLEYFLENHQIHVSELKIESKSSQNKSQNLGQNLGQNQGQNSGQNRLTIESIPESNKPSKHSACKSLLHTGEWKNFKTYGFSRKVKNHTITSIYEPGYHFENPHFNVSMDQHFTGTWQGESQDGTCEIKTLTEKELKTCFKGTTKMKIFGDSRARQIYQSMTSYLRHSKVFFDEKTTNVDRVFPGILSLGFEWSNGFEYNNVSKSFEKTAGYRFYPYELHQNFVKSLEDGVKKLKKGETLIGIVGEHFLWTLKYWSHDAAQKPVIDDHETEFIIKRYATPFKDKIVPWINSIMNKTTDLTLLFIGSHSSVSGFNSMKRRKLSLEYNRQLSKIIEDIGHEKVKFMDSVFEIGQSPFPDFNPLVVDGTHLNYRVDNVERFGVVEQVEQTDAQLAIDGVLVNTLCEGKLTGKKSEKEKLDKGRLAEASPTEEILNYCCF